MFSLHYFFKDKISLDNLITNIKNNIAVGGYLVGACFDGLKIFEYLKDLNINEEKSSYKEGKTIWKIIKKYSKQTFEADDSSLGTPIKVYMYSINKVIEEYLVNFEYFKLKLLEHNIDILDDDDMEHMMLPKNAKKEKISIGGFGDVFNSLITFTQNKSYNKQFNTNTGIYKDITQQLSETEKDISFFSKYFIFKKRPGESIEVGLKVKKVVINKPVVVRKSAPAIITAPVVVRKPAPAVITVPVPPPPLVKKIIIRNPLKIKPNPNLLKRQQKLLGILALIQKKVDTKMTTGLYDKISTIIAAFDKKPFNTDTQIKKGLVRLAEFKQLLKGQ